MHPVWPIGDQSVPEQAAVSGCLLILLDQVVCWWMLQVEGVIDALRKQQQTGMRTLNIALGKLQVISTASFACLLCAWSCQQYCQRIPHDFCSEEC